MPVIESNVAYTAACMLSVYITTIVDEHSLSRELYQENSYLQPPLKSHVNMDRVTLNNEQTSPVTYFVTSIAIEHVL